jgi:hypothetical protein
LVVALPAGKDDNLHVFRRFAQNQLHSVESLGVRVSDRVVEDHGRRLALFPEQIGEG